MFFFLITILFFSFILNHVLTKRKFYFLSWSLPGPFTLPFVGNALIFFCKNEDIFEKAVAVISKYLSPMRFWFGPKFTIVFSEPEQAAKILSSMNFAAKDEIYKFMKITNGEGLISGSGPKWKKDRKLMAPLFLKKNMEEYFSVVCHHTNILLEKLETQTDGPFFNIEKYLHRGIADFVNESIIGVKTDAQNGHLDNFLTAVDRMYGLIHARIVKVWLQVEWIFRFTHYYKEQERDRNTIHRFLRNVIRKAQERRLNGHKSTSLLDKVLDIKDKFPHFATEEELVHHLTTLYSASEDTVTTTAAFTLLLFGMYPQIQNKVVDEISNVLSGTRPFQLEDLTKFDYLEMCIKDVLRLFPIAPFIMRESSQDFQLDKWRIPKKCSVVVSIYNIHRNSKYWERPNEFYPAHFLPEVVAKRHPYAYLPFSAGPRGCLGKPYAYMALKIVLISIVQKYKICAEGTIDNIKLKTDISVRPKNRQFPVKITLR